MHPGSWLLWEIEGGPSAHHLDTTNGRPRLLEGTDEPRPYMLVDGTETSRTEKSVSTFTKANLALNYNFVQLLNTIFFPIMAL